MKKRRLQFIPIALVFVSSICASQAAYASDDSDSLDDGWKFRLGVPLWASGVEGTIGVRGREGEVDEDFTDILDVLDFTAALNFDARKGRWFFYANSLYLKTTTDAEPRGLFTGALADVELEQTQFGADLAFGYSIIKKEPFRLDVIGGTRLTYIDAELKLDLPSIQPTFSDSKFWADPIVGLQAEYRFAERWALYAKGDVGGFGVSSDLTWQVEGGLDFNMSEHTYLRFGYRYLSIDFEDDGFTYDVQTSGPQLEFGFRF